MLESSDSVVQPHHIHSWCKPWVRQMYNKFTVLLSDGPWTCFGSHQPREAWEFYPRSDVEKRV